MNRDDKKQRKFQNPHELCACLQEDIKTLLQEIDGIFDEVGREEEIADETINHLNVDRILQTGYEKVSIRSETRRRPVPSHAYSHRPRHHKHHVPKGASSGIKESEHVKQEAERESEAELNIAGILLSEARERKAKRNSPRRRSRLTRIILFVRRQIQF